MDSKLRCAGASEGEVSECAASSKHGVGILAMRSEGEEPERETMRRVLEIGRDGERRGR